MRDKIINPCSGKFQVVEDTIEINLLSKFSAKMTDCLQQLFNTATEHFVSTIQEWHRASFLNGNLDER